MTTVQTCFLPRQVSSLANAQTVEDLKLIVESANRSTHTGFGKVLYWNPVNGDDGNGGTKEEEAVATFAQAHSLATDGGHDIIFIMPNPTVDITIITENIILSKDWVFLRSVGKHLEFRTTSGVPITVSGYGCQLESFGINGVSDGGTNNLINVTGGFCSVKDLFMSNSTDHGLVLTGVDNCKIENVRSNGNTNDGIRLNDSKFTELDKCTITSNGGNGLHLTSTTPSDTLGTNIRKTTVSGNTLENVAIEANVVGTLISDDSIIVEDGGGRLIDEGLDTTDADLFNALKNIRAGRSLDR